MNGIEIPPTGTAENALFSGSIPLAGTTRNNGKTSINQGFSWVRLLSSQLVAIPGNGGELAVFGNR